MDYRSLGASGLNVPVIGLGTANFRGGSDPVNGIGDKLAARLLDIAIERGAAFFDTGDIYGPSEQVLGKALAKRRPEVLIATKAGLRAGAGANDTGASRHHLIEACDRSLKRLGTDYIDLFRSTASTAARRSRKRFRHSTGSSRRARCAISAARTTRDGN
jgi:aryl-alcohol dehydrogenase-like predicted oxidoreductase